MTPINWLSARPDVTSIAPPSSTLAHLYANVHANLTMPEPTGSPLVHSQRTLREELHYQYSFIAIVVLTSLFIAVTMSATGLLLAFCKKKNTVFSLQKCEQDSQFEMDDLENTDVELCHDDLTSNEGENDAAKGTARRSQSYPLLSSFGDSSESFGSNLINFDCDLSAGVSTPLVPRLSRKSKSRPLQGVCGSTDSWQRSDRRTKMPPLTHAVTIAAIHHTDTSSELESEANCGVRIKVEDVDFEDDRSLSSFRHLKLEVEASSEADATDNETEGNQPDSDVEDAQHDPTMALLRH